MLELIIAIALLSFGIIGIYNAFYPLVTATQKIALRFTAANLAQEGVEIIRNMRDNNFIQNGEWDRRIKACQNGCEADYTTDTNFFGAKPLTAYGSGTFLNIDNKNGFYSYSAGVATKFKRRITVDKILDTGDILKVTVLVDWDYNKEPFSFTTTEYLYDWY